jgi:catechol 2,3-dioxygenase-like lactoylglutathione lyase family enzyme
MIGTLHAVVIDCPDPSALATFYQNLLGFQRIQDEPDWISIGDGTHRPRIAFQPAPNLRAPRWPDPEYPQQLHIDVKVDDVDEAERRALELGARRLPGQGMDYRVFADPAGHPFCLVW